MAEVQKTLVYWVILRLIQGVVALPFLAVTVFSIRFLWEVVYFLWNLSGTLFWFLH